MGLIVVAEAARTQLRVASFDGAKLNPSVPGDIPQFEAFIGERWDLDEVVRKGHLLATLSKYIEQVALGREAEVQGVGVAVTGSVGVGNMMHLTFSETYLQVNFMDLFSSLRRKFPNVTRTIVDNRSNLGAWGEYKLGWRPLLVPTRHDLLYITIASGIAGGIVINDELWRGVKGVAGEIGHIILDPQSSYECPACKQRGCASELASGRALVRDVKEHKDEEDGIARIISAATGDLQDTSLASTEGGRALTDVGYRGVVEVDRNDEEFDARSVLIAGRSGSLLAKAAVERMVSNIAKLIAEVAYILDPSIVVLGGIVAAAPEIHTDVDKRIQLRPPAGEGHYLRTSLLGDRAALYGAALLVNQQQTDVVP